jgi:hypothetical protein
MFDKILDHLTLGNLLTLIFGLASIYFFFRSRKRKIFAVDYLLSVLQTKSHPEITISFHKRKIENLWRVYLLFWNAGQKEIRASDIPSQGGPAVEFVEGTRVLSSVVKKASSDEISFMTSTDTNLLKLHFDFLNPGDGAVIEVLFEDLSDRPLPPLFEQTEETLPFKLKGSIIGTEKIQVEGVPRISKRFFYLLMLLAITIIWDGIISLFFPIYAPSIAATLDLITSLTSIIIGLLFLFIAVRGRKKKRVPQFAREFI